VKLDKDTTDALGALLHPTHEMHQGTSELAVRGPGTSELVQLDKRGLNPFATFTSGNAGAKVSNLDSCRSINNRKFCTSGRPHRRRCQRIQHWSQQL
jgi:hypothetical protein